MEITRVSALAPPEKGKSRWARTLITDAIEKKLAPALLPVTGITSFTVPLPPHVAQQLKVISEASGLSVPMTAGGLIEAAQKAAGGGADKQPAQVQRVPGIVGAERVRPILYELLESAHAGMSNGNIVFAEAATGTGKGRMIASLATAAAQRGDTVVVAAPLSVTWQLMDELMEIPEVQSVGATLTLGRANFVSPEVLTAWAMENDHQQLMAWIKGGGLPLSSRAKKASSLMGKQLRWLLDDALSLADNLPVNTVMLAADQDEGCEGEQAYRSLQGHDDGAAIILCSHHMLASHIRQAQMRGLTLDDAEASGTSLPMVIDTLIVDEAHLLEAAFAAINTHTLHLLPLIKAVKENIKKGRAPLLAALDGLSSFMATEPWVAESAKKQEHKVMSEIPGLKDILVSLDGAITGALPAKSKVDTRTMTLLQVTRRGIQAALSGSMVIRFDLSPVKHYPQLIIGRANLEKALSFLWDCVAGATLVSATLYSDNENAKLARWKLAVPPERAQYLQAVHPAWVREAVRLQGDRVPNKPDDSDEWLDAMAQKIREVAQNAVGGTLVLCTSYQNAAGLEERLVEALGERLISQVATSSASICAELYRKRYSAGVKPVWIGVGSAWTGIDLTDNTVDAEEDYLLTDLVVTRIPLGINRSITHQRRVAISGFSIVAQEAAWQLRQGLGRLVRREGVPPRNLWVLDSRLDENLGWIRPFKRILDQFDRK